MRNEMITYALDISTGEPVFIRSAIAKQTYRCEACEQSIRPVQGPINAWHFRHLDKKSTCTGGRLTLLHEAVIQIIATYTSIRLPGRKLNYHSPVTRKIFHDYYPDIYVTANDGKLVHFEVKVTHSDKLKEEWYRKGNHRCVEIDVSSFDRNITIEELTPIVIEQLLGKRIIYWEQPAQPTVPVETAFLQTIQAFLAKQKELIAIAALFIVCILLFKPKW